MSVFNGVFPILPGKLDAARAFARQVSGDRKDGFVAMQKRVGTGRETWTIQQTPAGALMLVWFEGDVEKAFTDLATASDDFAVWFRAQILSVTGVDMSAPNDAPPPEFVVDWTA
jgi:hypothetical protein